MLAMIQAQPSLLVQRESPFSDQVTQTPSPGKVQRWAAGRMHLTICCHCVSGTSILLVTHASTLYCRMVPRLGPWTSALPGGRSCWTRLPNVARRRRQMRRDGARGSLGSSRTVTGSGAAIWRSCAATRRRTGTRTWASGRRTTRSWRAGRPSSAPTGGRGHWRLTGAPDQV